MTISLPKYRGINIVFRMRYTMVIAIYMKSVKFQFEQFIYIIVTLLNRIPLTTMKYTSFFYPTKSLLYMMVRLFCLYKYITMSKNDEDAVQFFKVYDLYPLQ
ncbi:hypothetical protein BDB01DRAFT_901218 [Pilobolus umbonatus]|nr:hypothetical protein BDB01DRAFT_901218 [Pilobolus umbonatus]